MGIGDIVTKLNVNSTTVLTGMGVTGVVATAYLAARGGFKAAHILAQEAEQMQDEHGRELTKKEVVKAVWPVYIPAISVGATTITAIVMSNHVASKKVAALVAASSITERAFQEYKQKVVEKIGEKKETGIRDDLAQDRVSRTPLGTKGAIIVENGDVLCFDQMTGRYFHSSMEKLRKAENRINFEILNHMYASLSAFYDEVGLAPTSYSDEVGWNGNELFELKFSTVLSPDGRPCIAFDFARAPFAEYSRLW